VYVAHFAFFCVFLFAIAFPLPFRLLLSRQLAAVAGCCCCCPSHESGINDPSRFNPISVSVAGLRPSVSHSQTKH